MSRTNHLLRNPLWSAIDVDLRGYWLQASYGRCSLNALAFLKKAMRMFTNKPLVLVDRALWIDGRLRGLD
jgi:transposase-like protein